MFGSFTWEQRELSELATMNARIGWQNLRSSEFLDSGDYMLITGTDFKDGTIDYSKIHYVDKERYDQDKKIQIKDESILITKDGTLGKVAYIQGLSMPATLNAGVFNVRVKADTKVDSKYLFHYLKAPFLLKFADEQSTGGTIKHLNQNVLVKFPIPLSSIEEQTKIGDFFTNLDHLITLHQRMLLLFFIAVYISLDNDLITKSVSWFSSSCMICKYVFCVVVILECPNLLATLAIVTPSNSNKDACV